MKLIRHILWVWGWRKSPLTLKQRHAELQADYKAAIELIAEMTSKKAQEESAKKTPAKPRRRRTAKKK